MGGEELGRELPHVRGLYDEGVRGAGRVRQASAVHAIRRAGNNRESCRVRSCTREGISATSAAHEHDGLHGLVVGLDELFQAARLLVGRADPDLARDLELGKLLLQGLQVGHVRIRTGRDDDEAADEHACPLQVQDDALRRGHFRRELELLTSHHLVDVDVAVSALHHLLVRKLRGLVVLGRVEAHLQESIANILLRELLQLQLRLCLHQSGDVLVLASLHLGSNLRVLRLPLLDGAHP
mmetsp:Transcript_78700/g.172523  ORF Transcript_78700/g.172523 Transcript_78700/m.172523 type:complete len:239 (+) Transcript_78700:882-1598(+)